MHLDEPLVSLRSRVGRSGDTEGTASSLVSGQMARFFRYQGTSCGYSTFSKNRHSSWALSGTSVRSHKDSWVIDPLEHLELGRAGRKVCVIGEYRHRVAGWIWRTAVATEGDLRSTPAEAGVPATCSS